MVPKRKLQDQEDQVKTSKKSKLNEGLDIAGNKDTDAKKEDQNQSETQTDSKTQKMLEVVDCGLFAEDEHLAFSEMIKDWNYCSI